MQQRLGMRDVSGPKGLHTAAGATISALDLRKHCCIVLWTAGPLGHTITLAIKSC